MAQMDLSPTFITLYEQALWRLVKIDQGLHGQAGREVRAFIADEASHFRQNAFGGDLA